MQASWRKLFWPARRGSKRDGLSCCAPDHNVGIGASPFKSHLPFGVAQMPS